MIKSVSLVLGLFLMSGMAAQAATMSAATSPESACRVQAIGKNGKPLTGAALNSFVAKCKKKTCDAKAIDKNGKPLAGAAKASFLKKCNGPA